jgi:adenylosuccinate synthase
MDRAVIVTDLGFGDAGKGKVTDALVRRLGAGLVVRFNGGAQAGHNVVTRDGRHHTFAQLGAGSFVHGVRTLLSRHVVVHPTALLVEARHLGGKGVSDALERVSVAEDALITTPYHQCANRLRELGRGLARHGSCGVGFGETVADAGYEDAIFARDLRRPDILRHKIDLLRERKLAELDGIIRDLDGDRRAASERAILESGYTIERWVEASSALTHRIHLLDGDEVTRLFASSKVVIFEGAQGVLLDEEHGFNPHTTYSRCTSENAIELIGRHANAITPYRLGLCRTYGIRHGAGPFPTEDSSLDALLAEPHNDDGPWQGAARRGWLDCVLLRYAIRATGGVDGLAVTHVDALARLPRYRLARGYIHRGEPVRDIPSIRSEERTAWITGCVPRLTEMSPVASEVLIELADELAVPIVLQSTGPTADETVTEARTFPWAKIDV